MNKDKFISKLFENEIPVMNEGKVLRVFDFDDTLAKTSSNIYVKHSDGTETEMTPGEYAVYNAKPGDSYDFRDFRSMLKNPQIIKKNVDLLKRMLNNPSKRVTILTARGVGFPIKKYFKDVHEIDVYVVALDNNDPQKKANWIEKHIKKGYTSVAFMDDSKKNIDAVNALKSKYPNIEIKTKWVTEHIREEIEHYVKKLLH